MYVAVALTVAGTIWFIWAQRTGRPASELPARRPDPPPGEAAESGEAAAADSSEAGGTVQAGNGTRESDSQARSS